MSESKNEGNYYFIIIVLLIVMLLAVAGLWVIEHKKLNRAVAFIHKQQNERKTQDVKLRDMLMNAELEKNHMLDRDRFQRKSVNVNGLAMDVFLISHSDATKAGLMEGDVVFVGVDPSADSSTAAPDTPAAATEKPETDQ